MNDNREAFGSRLGFILVSAGCAIGLGNVWRFPFITGQYGGAAFVLIYLFFLAVFGFPILVMEFAVGRASRRGVGASFARLEKPGHKWHYAGVPMIAANYLLMMFYTTVTGWMLYYFYRMVTTGDLITMSPAEVGAEFGVMLSNAPLLCFWMVVAVSLGLSIVALGLKKGVEGVTKIMMSALLVIMLLLMLRAVTLPGAAEGLKFYLMPDFAKLREAGLGKVIFAALGQSFFTLSLGIGSMSIFGSYIDKRHSLPKEAANICILDTGVALVAGLIIIPSCFAFGLSPNAGPGLIFATLPNVFAQMPAGRICGAAFFLFMSFAALSTLVAVFENIVAYWIDVRDVPRVKAVKWNFVAIVLLSLPCALGFNVLSGFEPFGAGSCVLDLEDFLVSNTFLPLGALVFVLFCNHKFGWKQENFLKEANLGNGIRIPVNPVLCFYFKWVLPVVIFVILVFGYLEKFAPGLYARIFD